METAMLLAMASNMDSLLRVFIEPELEKELGHLVTEYDWQVYQQEEEKKRRALAMAALQEEARALWNNLVAQFQLMAADREKIRNFVWGGRTAPQFPALEAIAKR